MPAIGFIGLGHMGFPMVKNLLKNNYTVKVYDVVEKNILALVKEGAVAASSVGDAAYQVDAVITMLQTGEQVHQCCTDNNGIFSQLKNSHALYIDCSSIDIQTSRALHDIATKENITMCDAPVSGGVAAAAAGTLTFMVGAEEKVFDRVQPVLSTLGKKIIYAGKAGAGVAAKICNNMLLGISMIGVCETFLLADKLGLSAQKLFEICVNASGDCWSLKNYCPWPNILSNVPSSHDYQPGFTAKMMLKDLALSQQAAEQSHLETPLGKHATVLYRQFCAQNADIDFSAIIKMLSAS